MAMFSRTATITAGSQFLGTEFAAQPGKPNTRLRAKELYLKMGSESKTWQIVKRWKNAAGTTIVSILRTNTGTETDVYVSAADLDVPLLAGEQLGIVTTAATAAMNAEIIYEEEDNTAIVLKHDPQTQR